MARLEIGCVALAAALVACGPRGGAAGGTGGDANHGGDGGGLIKEAVVSFGVEDLRRPGADPGRFKVWLQLTDETGAARSFPVDEIEAACDAEPGGDLGAIGTLRCWWAGAGANYIVVVRAAQFLVLRQWTGEGLDEPADYEELTRVPVPPGAKVTFQP
jgi:hypothetical protein